MNKEDKELLLKDLCARLPYEPVIEYVVKGPTGNGHITCKLDVFHIDELLQDSDSLVDVKPYLRPMSSMTEKEKEELHIELCDDIREEYNGRHTEIYGYSIVYHNFNGETWHIPFDAVDWLNSHHFDYRGLIDKGIAIEVTEENNPYKD